MRLQSSHPQADRGLDAYFTPIEAIKSLIAVESPFIPLDIWEPACGDGAISEPLRAAGYSVLSSDIKDYGYKQAWLGDYLTVPADPHTKAIITNPPYRLAQASIEKALKEVPYSAWLLRTNFLESLARLPFFRSNPPSRIWISSRRLPMMHRHSWAGPEAPSNTCFAWFIWDRVHDENCRLDWFDWAEHCDAPSAAEAETLLEELRKLQNKGERHD